MGFGFVFSSRRRHTRCGRDWSSDVCSSDLMRGARDPAPAHRHRLSMARRIAVAATGEFGADVLERLAAEHDVVQLFTRLDKPQGRGRKVAPPPAKEVAQRLGITVEQPAKIDSSVELGADAVV